MEQKTTLDELTTHETIVLAASLVNREVASDLQELVHLQGYIFSTEHYKALAENIVSGWWNASQNAEILNVNDVLERSELIDYEKNAIFDFMLTDSVPSLSQLRHHASTLKKKRAVEKLYDKILTNKAKPSDYDTMAAKLLETNSIRQDKTITAIGLDLIEDIKKYIDNPTMVMSTGLKDLDMEVKGIYGEDIIVVGGYSGGGKSNLLTTFANNIIEQGKRVCFISNEDNPDTMLMRFICSYAGIPMRDLRTNMEYFETFKQTFEKLNTTYSKYLKLAYIPSFEEAIGFMSYRAKNNKDDIYFVDYIQQFSSTKKYPDERQRLIYFAEGFKDFKAKYNKPQIIAAQLTKDEYKNKSTDSFAGSQAIRNMASLGLVVKMAKTSDEVLNEFNRKELRRKAKIEIIKGRFGESGTIYGYVSYPDPKFKSKLYSASEVEEEEFTL